MRLGTCNSEVDVALQHSYNHITIATKYLVHKTEIVVIMKCMGKKSGVILIIILICSFE